MINIDDFSKVEIKTGTILSVDEIEGSEKLYKLSVDFGEESPRTVLSGIKSHYKPISLLNKQFVFVTNLEPRHMMGLESQGMLMAVGESPVLLKPAKKVPNGASAK